MSLGLCPCLQIGDLLKDHTKRQSNTRFKRLLEKYFISQEYLDFAVWDSVWYSSDLKDGTSSARWLNVLYRDQDDLDALEIKASTNEFNLNVAK